MLKKSTFMHKNNNIFLKNYKIITIMLLFLFIFSPIIYAQDSVYVWSSESSELKTNNEVSSSISSSNETHQTSTSPTDLSLESGGAVLIEQNSGKVLYDHNMHEQLRPASVTKVMTILLIMEAIDSGTISYTDKIPCSENAASMGGSQIWLDVREELTVDEMLKAICVVSANDCTVAMAEYLAGSEEAFVQKMNEKAKSLGMNDTTFKNCHGIDEDGHVTSPYDIALMSRELLTKHPDITKYTTIWMDSLRDGKSELVNTNKLIRNYKGATGLKTGSTSVALYNLSASATRDDLSLIAVIMKAPSTKVRFAEAQKLLDYGFNHYEYKKLASKGEAVKSIIVNKGIESQVNGILETDSGVLIEKGQNKDIEQIIELPDIVSSPITKGDILGNITYTLNGEEIGKVNVIAENSIERIGLVSMIEHVYLKWFTLFRV